MPCGGPKIIHSAGIFSFWSFEISEDILRNQKFIIGFMFITNVLYIWSHLDNISLCIDYPVESCKRILSDSLWLHVAKSKGSAVKRLK